MPTRTYLGGSKDFDESTGTYRSGYVPPRATGGAVGAASPGAVRDPHQTYLAYQSGTGGRDAQGNPLVREAWSMDNNLSGLDLGDYGDNHGELRRRQVDALIAQGYVSPEHQAQALEKINQWGGNWYYDANNKLFDPNGPTSSYNAQDPAQVAAANAASNQGHAADDAREQAQSQPQTPTGQWNQTGGNTGTPRDQLFAQLMQRMGQNIVPNRRDPVIAGQADSYAAHEERQRRNAVSDAAEAGGPNANISGERRMLAERAGQRSGAFEAELMGREVTARRDEIQNALTQMGGMLSEDQQMALQREMAQLNAQLQREGHDLSRYGIDRNSDLQREGYDLTRRGQDIGIDQFLRELALREWDTGQGWDYRWAGLGM